MGAGSAGCTVRFGGSWGAPRLSWAQSAGKSFVQNSSVGLEVLWVLVESAEISSRVRCPKTQVPPVSGQRFQHKLSIWGSCGAFP